ncbi:hypothetical protein Psuf_002820 [Phytohabitans suffuscus]|uniref:Uncharacterized protein n=1 Tax=Phytohabitans suffuscus TaxID=624315 RepID=A0A6F8YAB2_9ACTN|nr:hypothetical protein Psuf_002820 [Phytohabitans suffuscus]
MSVPDRILQYQLSGVGPDPFAVGEDDLPAPVPGRRAHPVHRHTVSVAASRWLAVGGRPVHPRRFERFRHPVPPYVCSVEETTLTAGKAGPSDDVPSLEQVVRCGVGRPAAREWLIELPAAATLPAIPVPYRPRPDRMEDLNMILAIKVKKIEEVDL